MNLSSCRICWGSAASALVAALLACCTARADALYTFLVIDPVTTAGLGVDTSSGFSVTSTLSGTGTWHLYAVDALDSSFGIRSFNVKLAAGAGGSITATKNRTPYTAYINNSDPGEEASSAYSGFDDIRGSYATAISGGQSPLSATPIGGLGIAAGNFGAQTPGQSFSTTTSGQWGVYADPYTSGQVASTGQMRSAVFLGEGSYTGAPPTVDLATPMAQGGTGFNTWINADITRSDLALYLSSSNPFNCTACATGNDPNLVSRVVVPAPPQPTTTVLPVPPTPPVAAPEPATGAPPSPPPSIVDPATVPVAPSDPQPETQPSTDFYPDSYPSFVIRDYPESIFYYSNIASIELPTTGDEWLNFNRQNRIDLAADRVPEIQSYPLGGLQAAMLTALTGLQAVETTIDVVPNAVAASFYASSAQGSGLTTFDSTVETPEPAALTLIGSAILGVAGFNRRRRH